MAKVLIHLTTGPENPTRAALALLVARTAADEGHDVRVFIAGDGVHLARPATAAATHGIGTGSFAEHYWEALVQRGVPILRSGMSSKGRGIDAETAAGSVELAPPTKLIELATCADATLTY
jgi:predicted peroxiredoxin